MHSIISYASTHAFNYKTDKSIYNILSGKKTHQTFFDACSQQLLSLYHSFPKLKYPSFERFITEKTNENIKVKIHPRYTYDSLINTFSSIQLLVQSISHYLNKHLDFTPVSQHIMIQQKVKQLYIEIIQNNLFTHFQEEIERLFTIINQNNKNHCYLHYYLQGYEESMYTRQQVSLIENVPIKELFVFELNNLVDMMFAIESKKEFPLLSKLIILPSLLNKTALSYQQLTQGLSMEEMAIAQDVKLNTIEDHILELFIKGYHQNYQNYIPSDTVKNFEIFYLDHRGEKLKVFKEAFNELSYFQIKLIIVGIERGDIYA
ncbi:hypothetical protein BUY43_10645 [Staphylococcus devriesei]|uniref:Helicase Helix-turn-helix domain-containing protein n=3 Tax=Staphylococcus devriesei TaxID=586733 RepID=A0A2K4DJV1_9STAP|nr:helix-turn-helix domain-containing protein [Staphylococcus devriesei]MCE5089728.1 helix-turn-helix domain-containing protein [Staphylococcus devriesei]MCE5097411.1 helix-turn-helix domain-containing protein [Staphylococcus devriesei]PNZ87107.1 hypothetical protein CD147_08995 [Staphylococcus devriesei]PTF10480.1 hypothetical protein BUY48_11150 [Staphylococcus devriesei]PTF15518.1 hypothetical protein BUY47_01695 [Staphylococcus devriesei]